MILYESSQDYLETILILGKSKVVKSVDIAKELQITKQSVSRAVKKLKENDYITIDDGGYISLTKKGLEVAEEMYDRHLTLTKFFINLGVEESIAKKDACKVEHCISKETFLAIKKVTQNL